MHVTSQLKMMAFFGIYGRNCRGKTILDIGSRSTRRREYNYRISADKWGLEYTGLDFEAGRNVDVVPENPYIWSELEAEQFDFVISGQAFEHNPFMWVTFAEVARVLKPGGIAFIIAPSAGMAHRFPYDCWRYYPDSWAALCALTGLTLTESMRDRVVDARVPGSGWLDSAAIATKPVFASPEEAEPFYANLAEITAPFKARRYDFRPATLNEGPCYAEYTSRLEGWIERKTKTDAAAEPAVPPAEQPEPALATL
jgi:SAM-dependent methyltransferase